MGSERDGMVARFRTKRDAVDSARTLATFAAACLRCLCLCQIIYWFGVDWIYY